MRVLANPAFSNKALNPYNWLLYTNLEKLGVRVADYSKSRLLKERWDIYHVHWPDNVVRTPKYFLAVTRTIVFLMALTVALKKGANIVWTVHNLEAHEKCHPKLHNFFMNYFGRRVDGLITLAPSTKDLLISRYPVFNKVPIVTVPHGHYRDVYPNGVNKINARKKLDIDPHKAKVILFFGSIRSYKNVPALIRTFHSIDDSNAILLIAGKPETPELEKEVVQICSIDNKRILLHLGYISEDNIQLYFKAADLTVLPYQNILNSGSALLSLSYSVPALVPSKGSFKDLQLLLGKDWIRTYDGSLNPEEIMYHLNCVSKNKTSHLSMQQFDWHNIAKNTLKFYKELVSLRS